MQKKFAALIFSIIILPLMIIGAGFLNNRLPEKDASPIASPAADETPEKTPEISINITEEKINTPPQIALKAEMGGKAAEQPIIIEGNQIAATDIPPTQDDEMSKTETGENLINVTLKIEDGLIEMSVPSNQSVYDLMTEAKEQNKLSFSGQKYGSLGFFLTEINGKKNSPKNNMYWVYSINGKKAAIGISNYTLKPNDNITWTYEKGTF